MLFYLLLIETSLRHWSHIWACVRLKQSKSCQQWICSHASWKLTHPLTHWLTHLLTLTCSSFTCLTFTGLPTHWLSHWLSRTHCLPQSFTYNGNILWMVITVQMYQKLSNWLFYLACVWFKYTSPDNEWICSRGHWKLIDWLTHSLTDAPTRLLLTGSPILSLTGLLTWLFSYL